MKLIQLLRPSQWVKNAFVLAPVFFAGEIRNLGLLSSALLAVAAFSLAASAVYVFNDWLDRKADAKHPEKKQRPLASGAVLAPTALLLALGCLLSSGLIAAFFLNFGSLLLIAVYVILNGAYSFKLKHFPILDVVIIAIGFVLRLEVGSKATGIPLSSWILVLTFLLALLLALGKRRDDVLREERGEKRTRKAIQGYNREFLDHCISVMGSVVIVSYLMFCHAKGQWLPLPKQYLFLTSIFVILGLMRYMQLVFVEKITGDPSQILFKDRFTQLNLIAWLASFAWISH